MASSERRALRRALPEAERRRRAASYAAWLDERNGRVGAPARTLPRRERAMARAEALAWPAGELLVDPARYARNLARFRPEPGLDRATLWALCLAKASAAESFGASVGTNFGVARDPDVARVLAHIEAEEDYHARTARCLLGGLGLHAEPPPPGGLTRALVRAMAVLPEPVGGAVVVYAGEITAAALFRRLRESLGNVFAPGGEAHGEATRLLDEVIVDEEAHARFAASRLRPLDVALLGPLLPFVVRVLEEALPEAALLFGAELAPEVASVEARVWGAEG